MRYWLLLLVVFADSITHATVTAHLVPQLHRPLGQSWENTDPFLRAAVVSSQTEILNYFYERRAGRLVVFAAAHEQRYTPESRKLPLLPRESPQSVRTAFEGVTFPVQPEHLSERQQYLLFSSGAPAVAMSFGWVNEIALTESRWSQLRTVSRFTIGTISTLYRLFRPSKRQSAQEYDIRSLTAPDALFDKREREVLERLVAHAQANPDKNATEYFVVFGHNHVFPQSRDYDVDLKRAESSIPTIWQTYMTAMEEHMKSQMNVCQAYLEELPEDASLFQLIKAARKARRNQK